MSCLQSSESQNWLWAWANEDFSKDAREAAQALQKLHDVTGFRVFVDQGCGASAADIGDFVALAVHALEAKGYFRIPNDAGPTLYLAVRDWGTAA